MSENGTGLWAKVGAVQKEAGQVEKTGHVDFGKTHFDHFQEHGLLAVLKPLLEKHNLVLIPGADGYEKDGNHTIVNFHLTLVDPDTGEKHTEAFPNEGVDSSDKGFNKAYTGAMKYALQKMFLIPTDKVDEQEGSDEKHNQTSTRSNGDAPPKTASEAQLKLIERLAKKAGAKDNEAMLIHAYAEAKLGGGKDGAASRTIDALNGDDAGAAVAQLLEYAERWQQGQQEISDVPPDTEGLEQPETTEQATLG